MATGGACRDTPTTDLRKNAGDVAGVTSPPRPPTAGCSQTLRQVNRIVRFITSAVRHASPGSRTRDVYSRTPSMAEAVQAKLRTGHCASRSDPGREYAVVRCGKAPPWGSRSYPLRPAPPWRPRIPTSRSARSVFVSALHWASTCTTRPAEIALMERERLDAATAYERLRAVARTSSRKVADVARDLLTGVPLPPSSP